MWEMLPLGYKHLRVINFLQGVHGCFILWFRAGNGDQGLYFLKFMLEAIPAVWLLENSAPVLAHVCSVSPQKAWGLSMLLRNQVKTRLETQFEYDTSQDIFKYITGREPHAQTKEIEMMNLTGVETQSSSYPCLPGESNMGPNVQALESCRASTYTSAVWSPTSSRA